MRRLVQHAHAHKKLSKTIKYCARPRNVANIRTNVFLGRDGGGQSDDIRSEALLHHICAWAARSGPSPLTWRVARTGLELRGLGHLKDVDKVAKRAKS